MDPLHVGQVTLVNGATNYFYIRVPGPSAVHIAWDGVVNFNASQKIYSCARGDVDPVRTVPGSIGFHHGAGLPAQGALIATVAEYWSEESQLAFVATQPGAGCKVLHLGNWRAKHILFAVTPTAAGVVDFFVGQLGDSIHR